MKFLIEPEKIEQEAKRCGVGIAELLSDSNVSTKTWYRWRTKQNKPHIGTLERINERLEALRKKKAA